MATVQATGRRKRSTAKIFLTKGSGNVVINKRKLEEYFPIPFDQECVLTPFKGVSQADAYDVKVQVMGGGTTGQKEAIRHGISRALILLDPALRPELKSEGLLTRDHRRVQRKIPGRKKARGGHTYVKR